MIISSEVAEEDAEDMQLQQALVMSLEGHTGMPKFRKNYCCHAGVSWLLLLRKLSPCLLDPR